MSYGFNVPLDTEKQVVGSIIWQHNTINEVSHYETICRHTNGSLTGEYRWCCHLENAFEAAVALLLLESWYQLKPM